MEIWTNVSPVCGSGITNRVLTLTDDIIRLNKKEKQVRRKQAGVNRRPFKKKGRLGPGTGGAPRTAAQRGRYSEKQEAGFKLSVCLMWLHYSYQEVAYP